MNTYDTQLTGRMHIALLLNFTTYDFLRIASCNALLCHLAVLC